jgi:glycosyltransferase involved in cell wall biosynthesis
MKFVIVGADPAREILKLQRDPDVQVTGSVPDVRPYLRRAVVSICPMRVGAGVKGKVFESMALGTPVVSTSLGVEGLEVRSGHEVLIANLPEEFADQVCRLSETPALRARLARQARYLIEQKYDWNLVVKPLERIIDSFADGDERVSQLRRQPMLDAAQQDDLLPQWQMNA